MLYDSTYEVLRRFKFLEKERNRIEATRDWGWGSGEKEELLFNMYRVLLCNDEKVLQVDGGDG